MSVSVSAQIFKQCQYIGCARKPIYQEETICRQHYANPILCTFISNNNTSCHNRVQHVNDSYCQIHNGQPQHAYDVRIRRVLKYRLRLSSAAVRYGAAEILSAVTDEQLFTTKFTVASSNYLVDALNLISYRIANKQIGFGRRSHCDLSMFPCAAVMKWVLIQFCKRNHIIVDECKYSSYITILFNYDITRLAKID